MPGGNRRSRRLLRTAEAGGASKDKDLKVKDQHLPGKHDERILRACWIETVSVSKPLQIRFHVCASLEAGAREPFDGRRRSWADINDETACSSGNAHGNATSAKQPAMALGLIPYSDVCFEN
jgi:hypothetical protein